MMNTRCSIRHMAFRQDGAAAVRYLCMACLIAMWVVPNTASAQEAAVDIEFELLCSDVREAIGLGTDQVAILGLSDQVHHQVIVETEHFVTERHLALQEAIGDLNAAVGRRSTAIAVPTEFETRDHFILVQKQRVALLVEPLRVKVSPLLTGTQQALWLRSTRQSDLDAPLCFVSGLTSEKLLSLKLAQKRRDTVLRNPRNWHRRGVRRQANEIFEHVVTEILDGAQLSELNGYRAVWQQNFAAAMDREIELFSAQASGDAQQ